MSGANTRLFGTDGIRGPAGVPPLTPEHAELLGRCLGALLPTDRRTVALGRDPRESGTGLGEGLIRGLTTEGVRVRDAGITPTPAIARAVTQRGYGGGVMISASHNPASDNGLKFFGSDGFKLSDADEEMLESMYERIVTAAPGEQLPISGNAGREKGVCQPDAAVTEEYMAACVEKVSGRLDGLHLVVDCANGAASCVTPEVLRALGAEVEVLNASSDGWNINEACGCTHPEAVQNAVKASGADVGIAHDGDADRVLFCDETGALLDGDEIMALAALDMASRGRLSRSTIVATVMSNLGLDATLAPAGIGVIRCPVGDRHVVDTLRREGLVFGGEQSGHFVFLDHSTTGDGLLAALEMLAILRRQGGPLSRLRKGIVRFPQVQHAVAVREKPPIASVDVLAAAIAAAERALDKRGRVLVRYSGTEPRLRILVEGPELSEAEVLAGAIRDAAQSQLGMGS